ncbi:ABC transporter permease [Ramlibacter aurantiacus]|uniref:ABC transporter permease n=1 Tax=Ramlibacter aurantiacus TaxID=2801330 RepID=UPI00338FBAAE
MNPHAPFPVSLLSLPRSLHRHRALILQLVRREVTGRYKGSVMGILWSLVNPILMLAMYTFLFSVVFTARWGQDTPQNKAQFATMMFVGLIVHGLFAEAISRAPGLVVSQVNFVKKVVFPLEVLPVVAMGTALFHSVLSLGVLLVALMLTNGGLPWSVILLPLVWLPLVTLALGLAWMLASLGVFVRDVAHPIGMIVTALLFASPVFYPVSALPASLREWLFLNPLTLIIEQSRAVLMLGRMPDFGALGIYGAVALIIAWIGYAWFQKTRKGFANVL